MTQQNIIELAKQGNPKAIEVLINSSLQSKGITAKATFKDGFLQVLLESTQVPDKPTLVAFIRKGITSLGFTSIQKVMIHGKQLSELFPTWSEEFELVTGNNSQLSTTKSLMHKASSVQPLVTIQTLQKINRNIAIQKKPHKNKKIIAIASLSSFILLIGSFLGLIFWLRSEQTQTLSKAQTLVAKVGDTNNTSDITSLKAAQEQLNQIITALNKAPNLPLPGSVYPDIQTEKQKIITRLDAVSESLKMVEQLQPEIRLVIDEFSAVSSRLEVGMNSRKYKEQVGELKVALDRFTRQPGANEHPVYKNLTNAFNDYKFALEMWDYYIKSKDATYDFFPASSLYGTVAIAEYQVEAHDIYGEEYIHLDTALSQVWIRAGSYLKLAQEQTASKNEDNSKPINTKIESDNVYLRRHPSNLLVITQVDYLTRNNYSSPILYANNSLGVRRTYLNLPTFNPN